MVVLVHYAKRNNLTLFFGFSFLLTHCTLGNVAASMSLRWYCVYNVFSIQSISHGNKTIIKLVPIHLTINPMASSANIMCISFWYW